MENVEPAKTLTPLQVAIDDEGNVYFVLPKDESWSALPPDGFMPLLNEEQVAEVLGVSSHAVRKWRREGRIAHVKLSGAVRFEWAEVQAFVERNRRPAVA